MADLSARPNRPASSGTTESLTELHRLCDEDYANAQSRRQEQDHRDDAHLIADTPEEGDGQ